MCRSTVDIQSATADKARNKKRRTKERRKKPQEKNIMTASAMQGGHNKCSAAAEMSDHFAATDMGRKERAAVPLLRELGPHLTQYGLGRGLPPYQLASCSIQPFGQNRHGPKSAGRRLCPFGGRGAGSTFNTMSPGPGTWCGHTKWHLDPSSRLATTVTVQKLGAMPLLGRGNWVPM